MRHFLTCAALLLAAPLFPVSAGWAYKNRVRDEAAEGKTLDDMTAALREKDWEKCGALLRNDLSKAVFEKFPVLGMLRDEIRKRGAAGVEVSGSGPTLLAVFRSDSELSEAIKSLEAAPVHFPVRYYEANKVI